jgi:micrococcal nuclease
LNYAAMRNTFATVRDRQVSAGGRTVAGMPRHALTAALIVAGLLAAAAGWQRLHDRPSPIVHGTVVRAVDGDTIIVAAGARTEDVRLIGMDTPETVDPRRPVGCYGPQASTYTKHLLTGRRVTLEYDRVQRDRYGRYLAYVFLDGPPRVFVDARLVALGYARTMAIPPNTAHAGLFARLERRAALAGRGLWSACA